MIYDYICKVNIGTNKYQGVIMENKNIVYNVVTNPKLKLYSSRYNRLRKEGAALGYFVLRTKEQIEAIENGPFEIPHANRPTWCHDICYVTIESRYREVDPIFNGICRKNCADQNCTFKHGEYR